MPSVAQMPVLEGQSRIRWSRLCIETVVSITSTLAITGIIFVWQLYPRIPNISVIYLLAILVLARTYGRYAALLSSIAASLSFDFFIVPPLYTLTMARWEEWVALCIFLITALLTSQLTLRLRYERNQAHAREREAKILYELIRLTNSREGLEDQLEIVLLSLARVFSAWGVHACALLLPDLEGALTQLLDTTAGDDSFALSREEVLLAVRAMVNREVIDQRYPPRPALNDPANHLLLYRQQPGAVDMLRLVPLQSGTRSLGVLCLRIQQPAPWFTSIKLPASQELGREKEEKEEKAPLTFFWAFLEQASSILERARLQAYSVQPWVR